MSFVKKKMAMLWLFQIIVQKKIIPLFPVSPKSSLIPPLFEGKSLSYFLFPTFPGNQTEYKFTYWNRTLKGANHGEKTWEERRESEMSTKTHISKS